MVRKKRDYRKEYDAYQGKPSQIKRRSERNKARRAAVKKYGKSALKGKEVDHSLAKGRKIRKNLKTAKLRVISKAANRHKQPIRGKRRGKG